MIFFSNKCGQLGNRLFAFAHLIANARAYGYSVVNMSFDEYAQYFPATSADVFCRYPAKRSIFVSNRLRSFLFLLNKAVLKVLRWARWTRSFIHETVIADLPEYKFTEPRFYDLNNQVLIRAATSKPIAFLFGRFFRDYTNFEKFQDEIREFFTPRPDLLLMQADVLRRARENADIVVGVHMRRGDYREFAGGKYFFSQEEYSSKLTELTKSSTGRRITFVICSNEPVLEETFAGLQIVKGPGHLVADMYSLAACDYVLGPPSTFTLWASFYGRTPLYQIRSLNDPINLTNFKILPPEILYNFSFN